MLDTNVVMRKQAAQEAVKQRSIDMANIPDELYEWAKKIAEYGKIYKYFRQIEIIY